MPDIEALRELHASAVAELEAVRKALHKLADAFARTGNPTLYEELAEHARSIKRSSSKMEVQFAVAVEMAQP